VALGGVIATDIAFAAGAASIPGPITDIEDDIWMFFSSISGGGTTVAPDFRVFDSRAMRKIDEGSRLVIMIENQTGANIGFSVLLRVLAKVAVRS